MLRFLPLLVLFGLLLAHPAPAASPVRHDLQVRVDAVRHSVQVRDAVTLPEAPASRSFHFLLHAGLTPSASDPGVRLVREARSPRPADFLPGTRPDDLPDGVPLELYRVDLPRGARTFTVAYGGPIDHPIQDIGEAYARGFGVTPGIVSEQGVYLSGSSGWVPWLGSGLVTFDLDAQEPPGWRLVSQGARRRPEGEGGRGRVRWESPQPQDEIFLVGGPLTEYASSSGAVETLAFLRTPDPALARRYLEATDRYLRMYGALLGPYLYPKFALVENFWETGYGMPSFTLLGEKIIRFPFLLTSSYPHEILHNWWGNGVFVDYRTGNWSEGLTAYLSDHLFPEQKGEGAEYRQSTLQKYADYAARSKDFPLTRFTARHSSATEAVGYGKALLFFHMLRRELGDPVFVDGLRRFYREERFRFARFDDLRRAFEAASGRDLRAEFRQWVERAGAPRLQVRDARARADGKEYVLTAVLEQVQPGPPYRLRVPVAVTLEGLDAAHWATVELKARRGTVELHLPARPLRLDVDPEFDLFRLLDRAELPPALSGVFGADKVLIVLPAGAPEARLAGYRRLAEEWRGAAPGQVQVRLDAEVSELPKDRAVWVFGWENRLLPRVRTALDGYGAEMGADEMRIGASRVPRRGGAAVLALRHPGNPDLTVGWLAADDPTALPGLGRKLPHYHKWSYLGFEGEEPTNTLKGRWPVVGSPLTVVLPGADGRLLRAERGRLPPRRALAELPPAFSKEALLDTIRTLAAEDLRGRAVGSPGLDRAAELLAARMREAGLAPGGDDGTFFQTWSGRWGDPAEEVRLRNVVGVLPGTRAEWAGQSVVVGAHYDGQGLGLAGGHSEDRGRVHPGADDNASGVAVLLELARALRDRAPERSVVFVAFTGEEVGRLGSRHYAAAPGAHPAGKAVGMVNLDTVGRLGGQKLLALGTGSAKEWVPILQGAGYATGVTVQAVAADAGGSDQVSFVDAGVPAVQLSSGPHLDYHRPADTVDRIDADGLVQVAAVALEAVGYLASRAEPLSRPGADGEASAPPPSSSSAGRKVSLGTVPDFAYAGEGLRLSGVAPGSPAEKAGLREGDVIVGLGGRSVRNLKDLSEVLKGLSAGDRVSIAFRRDGAGQTAEAQVEAR
ncbi:MAG: M20/M25/M40 family metallo-hydrolase [Deltaproteobacteria bacterium]|nr:M20/M25/M40 family metallo-hydrolase [Deltaproteobacteria bacterium]